MSEDSKGPVHILEALKENPRGMSVTDIASAIAINRNTVSRYLDMLLISGQVEMKTYGKAKVFFLSQRVPLSSMIDLTSDMVFVLDRDMTIVQANDAICSFFNVERSLLNGKKLRESTLAAFDHPLIIETIKKGIDGDGSVDELRYAKIDGDLYFRVKTIPSVLTSGVPGVTILMEDITEHKKTEEALREREATFRTLVEEINDAIWITDQNLCFSYVSPRTSRMLGYPPEDMKGASLFAYIDEKDAGNVRAVFATRDRFLDQQFLVEFSVQDRTGAPVEIEASACPRYDGIGDFLGFRMVCRDVSERKAAMRKVSRWKSFLYSVVRNIPSMVVVRETEENRIIFANRAFEETFGLSAEEYEGKAFSDLFSPSLCQVLSSGDSDALALSSAVEAEEASVEITGRGTRILRVRKVAIERSKGIPSSLLGIIDDATEELTTGRIIASERDRAQGYLDMAGVMLAVIAPDGTLRRLNKKGSEMLGYTEEECAGRDWFETFIPARMKEELRVRFLSLMNSSSSQMPCGEAEEGILCTRKGEEIPVMWRNTVCCDDEGRITDVVTSAEPRTI